MRGADNFKGSYAVIGGSGSQRGGAGTIYYQVR